jgi:hypothetical protein
MQSLPAHERRAPIEARWARLGPRVEAALALNCDALTRACLIDSIVRGGVRDGVNLSNEGLLEVYLARQSSGVRARGLSGCFPRVVQAHATTLHVLLSRQPQRTLAAADAAFREARSSDSRARIPREKPWPTQFTSRYAQVSGIPEELMRGVGEILCRNPPATLAEFVDAMVATRRACASLRLG